MLVPQKCVNSDRSDLVAKVLLQKEEQAKEERDILQRKLDYNLLEVEKRASFKALVMETKLDVLQADLEKKETALHQVGYVAAFFLQVPDGSNFRCSYRQICNRNCWESRLNVWKTFCSRRTTPSRTCRTGCPMSDGFVRRTLRIWIALV